MEFIQPSSTARNDSVMALVIAATSLGECVPIGASRAPGDAAVFTEVLTEDKDAAGDDTDAGVCDRGSKEDAIDAAVLDAWLRCSCESCVASSLVDKWSTSPPSTSLSLASYGDL